MSTRCNNGIHHTCLAAMLAPARAPTAMERELLDELGLPTLKEICWARIDTRVFIGAGLLGHVAREFNKCTANVIAFSRRDAWDFVGTAGDTAMHRRARIAWMEWYIFAKIVLLVLPGGRAKEKRNDNILANLIVRWNQGELSTLWL